MHLKHINFILESPLISCFSKNEILNFINTKKFKLKSYNKNTTIHFETEQCHNLEIIISGEVIIQKIDVDGNCFNMSTFYEGDILGGNLLFSSSSTYPMNLIAVQHSIILSIDKETLFELLKFNDVFLRTYLEFISDLSLFLGNKIKNHMQVSLRESIFRYLIEQYTLQNSLIIKLPTSKKLLAEKLGVQRTSLSRELKKMQVENIISFDRRYIYIKNISLLKL